jgi:hypothetical protein
MEQKANKMLTRLYINSATSSYPIHLTKRKGKRKEDAKALSLIFPAGSIDQCCLTDDLKDMSERFHIMEVESYLAGSKWLKCYPNVAENFRLWISCEVNAISDMKIRTSPTALYNAGYLSEEVYSRIVHLTISRYCETHYKIMPDHLDFYDAKKFVDFLASNL